MERKERLARAMGRAGRLQKVESIERENYIVTRVREGATQRQIAEELGVTQAAVSHVWTRALKDLPEKTVDEYRALMMAENRAHIERLEEIINGEHPYVQEGRVVIHEGRMLQDVGPVLKAISTAVTLHKRLSDWIGADAPKRSEQVSTHVSAEDLRVTQLVRGISGGNVVREEEIRARVMARRALPPGEAVRMRAVVPHGAVEHRARGLRWVDRMVEA